MDELIALIKSDSFAMTVQSLKQYREALLGVAEMQKHSTVSVDDLAQFIRQIDGDNVMGAGALAENIVERFGQTLYAPKTRGEGVAWRASDDFPDSLPNTWSRGVVAVTDFGRVCSLSCMGTYWQRPADFAEGEEVVAWADFPNLERATDAPAVQGEPCAFMPLPSGDAIGGVLCTKCGETFEKDIICPAKQMSAQP